MELSDRSGDDVEELRCAELSQTRAELYDYLDYHAFEQKFDAIASRETLV